MAMTSKIQMVASGDLRPSANETCWPAQQDMEAKLTAAIARLGGTVVRAHPYKPALKHGFIASQKEGLEVFRRHRSRCAADRRRSRVAVFAARPAGPCRPQGTDPHRRQLVGDLARPRRPPQSQRLADQGRRRLFVAVEREFRGRLVHGEAQRMAGDRNGRARHQPCAAVPRSRCARRKRLRRRSPPTCARAARSWASSTRAAWACTMPSSPTNSCSRSASSRSACRSRRSITRPPRCRRRRPRLSFDWLVGKGLKFNFGPDGAKDLTQDQVLDQCRMYIAAVRLADEFGCESIGIQYQQGLKDLLPASDLVEGLLNNDDRPPVRDAGGKVIRDGRGHRPFQRGRRMRRPRRAVDQPGASRAGPAGGNDAARSALGRRRPLGLDQGLCVGVRDFRRRAAGPPCRRLCRLVVDAPAADVFPQGRRDACAASPSPARSCGRASSWKAAG